MYNNNSSLFSRSDGSEKKLHSLCVTIFPHYRHFVKTRTNCQLSISVLIQLYLRNQSWCFVCIPHSFNLYLTLCLIAYTYGTNADCHIRLLSYVKMSMEDMKQLVAAEDINLDF